jgi:hypothetical protein
MIPRVLPEVPPIGYRYDDNRIWRSLPPMPGWVHNKIGLYFVGEDVAKVVAKTITIMEVEKFRDPRDAKPLCDLVEVPEKAIAPIPAVPGVDCAACKGVGGENCNLRCYRECDACDGTGKSEEGSDGGPGYRVFVGDGVESLVADWLAESMAGLKLKRINWPASAADGSVQAIAGYDEAGDMVAVIMPAIP